MNTWLYLWRGILNISLDEFLLLTIGELTDLIDCYQISQGIAKEVKHDKFIPDLR